MIESIHTDTAPLAHKAIRSGLRWTVISAGAVAAVGLYPTYLLAGFRGLLAEAVASAIVTIVAMGALTLMVHQARFGAASLIWTYKTAAMGKMLLSVVLALGAKFAFNLPSRPLLLWIVIFYLAVLVGQSIWLSRTLRGLGGKSFTRQTSGFTNEIGSN